MVWEGPLETHCERYILRLQLLRPKFLESAFIWPGASSDNPCVRVVSPELGFYDGERRLPHTYYRNNRPASQADLCLFFGDEWSLDDMVADTIVPWAAEWLQFYEGWRATGTWFGPGLHPGDEEVNEWRRDRTDQPILPDDPPAPYRRCVDSYLGGGIKGLFTAALLARLEATALGRASIGGYFDLIAGTSTGGIIALGLGAGRSAREILKLYINRGRTVFPRRKSFGLVRPAFSATQLKKLLDESVSSRLFGESNARLCIPSCEGRYGDVNVFKTPHHPDFKLDWKVPMVDVGLATSAAPTILPVHVAGAYSYVDGGLWANNPAMVAVVDALSCFDIDRRQIRILSIGTGGRRPALGAGQLKLGGLAGWLYRGALIESLMQYGSLNADGQAGLLVGRDRMVRAIPTDEEGVVNMTDYTAAVETLLPAGERVADSLRESLSDEFFRDAAEPMKFYHGPNAETLTH